MTPRQHAHCGYCGSQYPDDHPWPRGCAVCGQVSYRNPLPVAVLLLPVEDGILAVRRGIEPGRGGVALPGGFLEVGETWQQGCARELWEETGVVLDPGEVELFRTYSAAREGLLLVFGLAAPRRAAALQPFTSNEEVLERLILPGPVELVFPLHTRALAEYFRSRG